MACLVTGQNGTPNASDLTGRTLRHQTGFTERTKERVNERRRERVARSCVWGVDAPHDQKPEGPFLLEWLAYFSL